MTMYHALYAPIIDISKYLDQLVIVPFFVWYLFLLATVSLAAGIALIDEILS